MCAAVYFYIKKRAITRAAFDESGIPPSFIGGGPYLPCAKQTRAHIQCKAPVSQLACTPRAHLPQWRARLARTTLNVESVGNEMITLVNNKL